MTDSRSMSIKAYMVSADGHEDVRRFGIPEGASTNYNYLEEKIRNIFALGSEAVRICWQDSDGDQIAISSDDELLEAITECIANQGQSLLRLYVSRIGQEKKKSTKNESYVHEGVSCDGCNGEVAGMRFKCKTCRDYDLCSGCEGKGVHNHHQFTKIPPVDIDFSFYVSGPDFQEEFGGEFPPWRFGRRGGCGRGRGGWKRFMNQQHRHHHNQHQQQGAFCGNAGGFFRPPTGPPPAYGPAGPPPPFGPAGPPPPFGPAGPPPANFFSASGSGCPFAGAGAGVAAGFGDAQKAAEEASKFATQMASKHVADIMKGIWTAWAGTQEGCGTSAPETASETQKNAGTSSKSSSAGIEIDIPVDDALNVNEKQSSGTSKLPETSTEKEREERSTCPPEVVLMDVEESEPHTNTRQKSPDKSSPTDAGDWTLLNQDSGDSTQESTPRTPRDSIPPSTFSSGGDRLYPDLATSAPSAPSVTTPVIPSASAPAAPLHPDERVRSALEQMNRMGYSDEGGWLTRLLEMKDGDINQVLDLLLVHKK